MSSSRVTVGKIADALETWAPPGSALSYDNVGLQVGRAEQPVTRALIALDATPEVVQEAREKEASLVITHHPLLFKPLESLTPHSYASSVALSLVRADISLYSIHTNLDVAKGGVSFALAEMIGLQDISFLSATEDALIKLVTFVPADHADTVRDGLASAGAGIIGDYEACAFASRGTGYFKPGEGTNPFIGESGGEVQSASEVRLETEVQKPLLGDVLRALNRSHPYEEVAYDIYPVKQSSTQTGLGAIGRLPTPLRLDAFLSKVAETLKADALRYAGEPADDISKVAVCGGAGSDLRRKARAAGADAYVTSDVKYHEFFDAYDAGGEAKMALVDAGHYETEAHTEELLRDRLEELFPDITWLITEHRTGPMKTFAPDSS